MGEMLLGWLGREGYLPHGYCFTWSPGLLWSMVGADAVIAASYYSIPIALVHFVRRRPDVQFRGLLWLFSAFIFACGTTHVLSIWTIWQPDYALETLTKVLTATVSLVTAVVLWPLIPQALRIPSVSTLQTALADRDRQILERKTVEEQLAETQQSLALTLASIGAGFIATDREGQVVRMNEVAERVTGWTESRARGRVLWEVFDREGRPAEYSLKNPIQVMIEQAVTPDLTHQVICIARDGSRTAVEARSMLTHGSDGSVRGLALVFRDLTQLMRVQAEAERLAAIVASSHDAIIGISLDGRITSWNEAAQALYGYAPGEAIGRQIDILMPPQAIAQTSAMLAAVAAGERIPAFDTTRVARDGRLVQVSLTVSPIRDGAGRVVGASKIARDISEARRVQQALFDSEARLRFTLEAGQIGDWELDLASGAMKVSPTFERCFGYREPRAGWNLGLLVEQLHPEDREGALTAQLASVAQGRDWAFEGRVVWPDGSPHWVRAIGRVPPDADPPTRMLGIVIDTTEQKLAEEARLKAKTLASENLQILEASRLKSEFLANMSHELRTPLNAIIGFTDLLHAGKVAADSPKQKVFFDHIRNSGRHLLQLINDILDLSKVEAGKFEFFAEPVMLSDVTGDVIATLGEQARAKSIRVDVSIDPRVARVVMDAQRLRQILFNYLSNALKFTPAGGAIRVRAAAENEDLWRLEVEDNGIGIQPQDIGRLFTEFQQLDGGLTKEHGGTGLGLALTRRLAEAMGGAVGVHSVPGRRTVFHALLPRDAGPSEARLPPAPHPPAATPTAGRPGRAVLVVEDNPSDAHLLAGALQEAGFEVFVAATAAQALALSKERPFAAITLDLLLPDRTGLELLADIRAGGLNREVPVVLVTVRAASLPGPLAAFSVTDVLGKPIDARAVTDALRRAGVVAHEHNVVLVVDDDRQSRELMSSVLASAGYTVSAYADARGALSALEALRPGGVILDLSMPDCDGFEFLERMRAIPGAVGTPVFVWTSRDLGALDYERLLGQAEAVFQKSGMDVAVILAHVRARLESN